MKINFEMLGASVFILRYWTWSWCHKTKYGTCLKHGRSWIEFYNVFHNDLTHYAVHTYIHKDKQTKTYWLVEQKVLSGTGKIGSLSTVEHVPMYQVEFVKLHPKNSDYCIVKRRNW